MSATKSRDLAAGYYWIRGEGGPWRPAKYDPSWDSWAVVGNDMTWKTAEFLDDDEEPIELGPRLDPPK